MWDGRVYDQEKLITNLIEKKLSTAKAMFEEILKEN